MWIYEKRLLYPVKQLRPSPKSAKIISMLLGGANGETTASITYLNQRYTMPYKRVQAVLTDIGTEELSHMEMLASMFSMVSEGCDTAANWQHNMAEWALQYNRAPFLADAFGNPWTATYMGITGDPIADITNDIAAEEKARAGYDSALRMCDDPDLSCALQFLREREIVHYQRFGEALNYIFEQQGR